MYQASLIIAGQQHSTTVYSKILNPSNGELVGLAPKANKDQFESAVVAAKKAFYSWSTKSNEDRKEAVRAIADQLEAHAEELAILLTQEQGKPLNGLGSRFELGGAVAWTRHTAELELPIEILQDNEEGYLELHRKPLGVVGSITPWNWPLMIAIWHMIPAVRSGNTVVLKPSPYTPLSTLRMVEIINNVLPAGVVNAVSGDDEIGQWISEHQDIQKIVFTGSTETGKKVMRSSASNLKRLTLELGGNDAGIVLPDADPKAIAEGLFWGAFINGGQTCAALKRLYVHESIYEQVCESLTEFVQNIPVGDGLDENNLIGPIQNQMQHDKVSRLVNEAKASGAKILCGGSPAEGKGLFYPLTLVANIDDGAALVLEEQFGPALPILKYATVEEAIERANNSKNGLGGSVWSADIDKASKVASQLECGSVWINKHGAIQPNAPFGGVKESGFGVEFAEDGLAEYTSPQVIYRPRK